MRRSPVFPVPMLLLFVIANALLATESQAVTNTAANNAPDSEDNVAIRKLLANYTASLASGNRSSFESQLLDLKLPFSHVKDGVHATYKSGLAAFQDYGGFRKVIFDSGKRYQQRFSNIRIEQVGSLAQVSLDYQTTLQGEAYEGKGWKVLQLIKLNGRWKIASEFFTDYPAS